MSHTQGRESCEAQSPAEGTAGFRLVSTLSALQVAFKTFCSRMTSWRYRIALLLHIASALMVVLRMNVSMALVCMIRHTGQNDSGSADGLLASGQIANMSSRQLYGWNSSSPTVFTTGEFEWESSIQGFILSSGGFIAFLIPLFVDILSRLIGAKSLMTVAMSVSAVLTLLNPLAARSSPYFLIFLRILIGASIVVVVPVTTELFSWWSPESEKVTLGAFAYGELFTLIGSNLGNILVGGPSGYMCSIPVDNGWPFIFYVHGGITILWCVFWHLFATVRPDDHPFISEKEKMYIIRSRLDINIVQKKSSPPYLAIAKSKPVWGYILLMSAFWFTITILSSYIPKYISSVFHFGSEKVGLITSVTHAARILGVVVFSSFSNLLLARTHVGKTTVRKIVQCSGFFLCAALLFVEGFLTSYLASLSLLNLIMMCQSSILASGFILPLDMAPRYSGFISGASMFISQVVTIPAPIAAGLMTPVGTLEEWRNVFILTGAWYVFGAVTFLLLGSADLQPWAIPHGSSEEQENNLPVTFDLMKGMTVMSIGPPISPKIKQHRFRFDTTLDYNFHFATYSRSASQLPNTTTDGGLVVSDLQNETRSGQTTVTPLEVHVCQNETIATSGQTQGLPSSASIIQAAATTWGTGQDYANPEFIPDHKEVLT